MKDRARSSISVFTVCRFSRMSAAVWYRSLRSFSTALLMVDSSLGGMSG